MPKLNPKIRAGLIWAALLFAGPVGAQEVAVTGEEWVASADDVKDGYLVGVLSVIDTENAVQGTAPADPSVIPTLKKGLHNMTIADIKVTVDDFYATHPDAQDKPVMHVIWDIAVQNAR